MRHTVKIDRYYVSPKSFYIGTNGSVGNDELVFEFSSDWKELDTIVTFYPQRSKPITMDYTGEPIKIPDELYSRSMRTEVVVSGMGEKRFINTVPFTLRIDQTRRPVR